MIMVLNVLLGVYGNILKFMIGCRNLLLTSIVTPVNRFVDERCYNPNNLKQNKLCLRENTSQVMVSFPTMGEPTRGIQSIEESNPR